MCEIGGVPRSTKTVPVRFRPTGVMESKMLLPEKLRKYPPPWKLLITRGGIRGQFMVLDKTRQAFCRVSFDPDDMRAIDLMTLAVSCVNIMYRLRYLTSPVLATWQAVKIVWFAAYHLCKGFSAGI